MRKPSEPRLEFLGEQDGEAERALKAVLAKELATFPGVKRAYLARVGFGPEADGARTLNRRTSCRGWRSRHKSSKWNKIS